MRKLYADFMYTYTHSGHNIFYTRYNFATLIRKKEFFFCIKNFFYTNLMFSGKAQNPCYIATEFST